MSLRHLCLFTIPALGSIILFRVHNCYKPGACSNNFIILFRKIVMSDKFTRFAKCTDTCKNHVILHAIVTHRRPTFRIAEIQQSREHCTCEKSVARNQSAAFAGFTQSREIDMGRMQITRYAICVCIRCVPVASNFDVVDGTTNSRFSRDAASRFHVHLSFPPR